MFVRRVVGVALVVCVVLGVVWVAVGGRALPASDPRACAAPVEDEWVRGGTACLHMRVYRSAAGDAQADLVVVLHGDAPFAPPSYQYAAARRIAAGNDDVIAVGMLRPGYTDAEGHRSTGMRGRAVGDNYTPAVVDAIAGAIDALKRADRPAHVVVVGHSGGAAIAADLIGRHPGIADAAVLVSCPCDVDAWRRHMAAWQRSPVWWIPISTLSPITLTSDVDTATIVRVVVGGADSVVPVAIGRAYAARLRARDAHVTLTEIPGKPHDILLDPVALQEVTAVLAQLRARR
jgi:pimeloyl-ACP methyl ester carboxylesterase